MSVIVVFLRPLGLRLGPFNDFRGVVSEIDMERTKVRVMVSFFGRETPVELDFLQVEKA